MGLKLNHIDAVSARGDLDGAPFSLEVESGRYVAKIGQGGQDWSAEGPVDAPMTPSLIRGLTYQMIASYRNACRPAFA